MSDAGDIAKKDFAVKLKLIREVDYSRTIDETLDFRDPKTVATFFKPLSELAHETAVVCFCNFVGQPIGFMEFSSRDERRVQMNPRAICAAAILSNCEIVILCHNHVSHLIGGHCLFSKSDIWLAKALTTWLKMFQIEFYDSVLISGGAYTSVNMQASEKNKRENCDPYELGDLVPTKKYFIKDKPLPRKALLIADEED